MTIGRRFIGLALLCGLYVSASLGAGDARIERFADHLEIRIGDQQVATYVFRDEVISRPYFANVKSPSGIQATRTHPPRPRVDSEDHARMHPGVFLAFGDISGSDFWRNTANVIHAGFVEEPKADSSGVSFTVRNRYVSGDRLVCLEVCAHRIERQSGGFLISFDSLFSHPGRLFTFGDQEEMGLGVRVARDIRVENGNGTIRNSDGRLNEKQVWGRQAAWCDYSGTVEGQRVGILVMPHPGNFRRSWFHSRDYGFLAANPFGRNAFTGGEKSVVDVSPGQALRLRFAVLIHSTFAHEEFDCDTVYHDFLRRNLSRSE